MFSDQAKHRRKLLFDHTNATLPKNQISKLTGEKINVLEVNGNNFTGGSKKMFGSNAPA